MPKHVVHLCLALVPDRDYALTCLTEFLHVHYSARILGGSVFAGGTVPWPVVSILVNSSQITGFG